MNVLNGGASKLSQNRFTERRHKKCPLRELPEKKDTIIYENDNWKVVDEKTMNTGFNACLDEILK